MTQTGKAVLAISCKGGCIVGEGNGLLAEPQGVANLGAALRQLATHSAECDINVSAECTPRRFAGAEGATQLTYIGAHILFKSRTAVADP